ncbi:SulP family inorganic anion transporter [Chitinilyticum piscinae]|uniref:STAS domain-containing protein n=1 Tax=Chitinilyticum piscinae TaxID=2866724 RepID=A0A8J7FIT8_9NEIS|nr:SulP family inorganic anion transporter [Chitinilyticum piscinae]MBE9608597.1 STAS domain-containing protein [Chitinilyticum piscinae]
MIALREAWLAGLFTRSNWLPNVIAGVIVGVVALPLAMAFAIASGAKPEQGLYTAIIAGFAVAAFGGSRLQIAGPTGAFVVILADITARYGIAGLETATLLAGIMLVLLGLARMGAVIRFIPAPVILGFTSGIGMVIWVGQWPYFFGLANPPGTHFHEKVWGLLHEIPGLHGPTTLLASLALLLTLRGNRLPGLRRVPGPLIALVGITLVQYFASFEGVRTIQSAFGGIPQQLPELVMPDLSFSRILQLIGPAFTIAMLGAIESLLSAVVADGMAGTRHDANQELIGQGIANLLTPLVGGFAATGAIARTATNVRNGGTGPLAGIVHSMTLLAILLLLAPLAGHIPLAVLAAILFVVAWNMSEAHRFVHMLFHAPRADVAILLITFVLTVFTDLVVAVQIGVILAILQFLRRMASTVSVTSQGEPDLKHELAIMGRSSLPNGTLVYSIDGPFFFAAAEQCERALIATHTEARTQIIRLHHVPFMDMTGLQTLEKIILQLQQRHIRVIACEANPNVLGKLERAGLLALLGTEGYRTTLQAALELNDQYATNQATGDQSA